jgi:hypothetical protein
MMNYFFNFIGNSAYSMDSASITLPTATVAPSFIDDSDPQLLQQHSIANTSYNLQHTATSPNSSSSSFQSYFSGFLERNYHSNSPPPCEYSQQQQQPHSSYSPTPASTSSSSYYPIRTVIASDDLPIYNPMLSPQPPALTDETSQSEPSPVTANTLDFINLSPPDETNSSAINDLLETSRNRSDSLRSATAIKINENLQKENQQPDTNQSMAISKIGSNDKRITRTQTLATSASTVVVHDENVSVGMKKGIVDALTA